jgi:hypothetical protein
MLVTIYEGTTIMPIFNLELAPKEVQTVNLELRFIEAHG